MGERLLRCGSSNRIDIEEEVKNISKSLKEISSKLDEYGKGIQYLLLHFQYAPGGPGYKEAKQDYQEQLKNEIV